IDHLDVVVSHARPSPRSRSRLASDVRFSEGNEDATSRSHVSPCFFELTRLPAVPAAGNVPARQEIRLKRQSGSEPAGPDAPQGWAGVSPADLPARMPSAQRASRAGRAVPRGAELTGAQESPTVQREEMCHAREA